MTDNSQAKEPIACAMGIMAYNEASNIGKLLESVLSQRLSAVALSEIIIIISGCTDGTEAVVRHWAARDIRIRVLSQPKREGKAKAVNLFLSEARERILVLCSADLLLEQNTIEQLVAPFSDPDVGISTCRPVPVNDRSHFMGFAAHLLWDLHHQINLAGFKCGEVIAFRSSFERIPYRAATDEASIEPVIRGQGYRARYVPEARVYNKGPETLADFIRQRRRIYAGHLAIREAVGYTVSTMNSAKLVGLALRNMDWRPRPFCWTWGVAALEVYSRFLGRRDFAARRDHGTWDVAATTKELVSNLPARPATVARQSQGQAR
jgi:cellulose synthase/poly-beta-1,6-N-acetylglucosamine synthase-like glycosyltransferase